MSFSWSPDGSQGSMVTVHSSVPSMDHMLREVEMVSLVGHGLVSTYTCLTCRGSVE